MKEVTFTKLLNFNYHWWGGSSDCEQDFWAWLRLYLLTFHKLLCILVVSNLLNNLESLGARWHAQLIKK